jgi:hypothetical protein
VRPLLSAALSIASSSALVMRTCSVTSFSTTMELLLAGLLAGAAECNWGVVVIVCPFT